MPDEYKMARQRMVDRLRNHYRVNDERVLSVMEEVPRHLFVPDALRVQAYRDSALPITGNQTISQPFIVARMTELLNPGASDRILEIGSGSGYQTVILSILAGSVYSVERVPELVELARKSIRDLRSENVTIKCGDGTNGWPARAPFDGILVAAGGPLAPEPLLEQLSIGGRLVIPVGEDPGSQELMMITRTENRFRKESYGRCSFVPLIGEHGWHA